MVGRLTRDGGFDARFNGAGLFSFPTLPTNSGFMIPTDVAERPDNRDLVVAMGVASTTMQPPRRARPSDNGRRVGALFVPRAPWALLPRPAT